MPVRDLIYEYLEFVDDVVDELGSQGRDQLHSPHSGDMAQERTANCAFSRRQEI